MTGPGGAWQWTALNGTKDYPSAFGNETNLPRMLTSDIALREDPVYANISMAYKNNFTALTNDFAHAWYVFLLSLCPLSLSFCASSGFVSGAR